MLSIIVAVAKNNVIGKNNKLLWHLPEDLKRFKELTTGHMMIMGSNTFHSLGRVLPNRKHLVLTDKEETCDSDQVEFIYSLDDAIQYKDDNNENFVIGGASIYKQLMPYCNKLYVTEIDKEFDGDVYFPEINKTKWEEISREKHNSYDYVIYIKRND